MVAARAALVRGSGLDAAALLHGWSLSYEMFVDGDDRSQLAHAKAAAECCAARRWRARLSLPHAAGPSHVRASVAALMLREPALLRALVAALPAVRAAAQQYGACVNGGDGMVAPDARAAAAAFMGPWHSLVALYGLRR
jgi:hypothetical protein